MKKSREELKNIIEEVFGSSQKEIGLKGMRGCVTFGARDINDISHCGDKECPSCNLVNEAFKEEMERLSFKPYEK